MRFSRILKLLVPLTLLMVTLTRIEINQLREIFNFSVGKGNLLLLTLIYLLLLTLYLVVYDLLIMKFDSFVSGNLDKFGKKLVQKERGEPAMRIIRIGYLWEMIYRFLRLGWISYGFTDRRGLWVVLSKASISQKFVSLFKNLLSLPVIFSFILACFSLNILNFTEIQEWVISSLNFKINLSDVFSDVFSGLPILATILTLIPTIFWFYFYSRNRDVRKITDREEGRYLEEVVLLYKELMSWIDQNLYKISQNYDYVVRVQKSIVEIRLEKRISNCSALKDRLNYSLLQIDNYRFIELPEVKDLVAVIDKLLSDRLCRFTRVVALKSYAIWELYWELSSLKDLDRANYSFYTKCGMDNDISNRSKVLLYVTEKNLEKEQEYESSTLAHDIYRKLKMLYVLKRGSDALRKYLYSSRIERFLVRALQKEK